MASPLDTHATNKYVPCVIFSWGPPTLGRGRPALLTSLEAYVCYDTDLVIGVYTYKACPLLEVTCDSQHGGVKDAPYRILMTPLSPLDRMSRPYPHARVTVVIGEVDPLIPGSYRDMFLGQVVQVKKNPSGRRSFVEASVAGIKANINWPLGLPVLSVCPWTFGDPLTCGLNIYDLMQAGTVDSIDGVNIEISGLTYPRAKYFRFGFVEFDGLRIDILEDAGSGNFVLRERVPPEWAGVDVIAAPGCGKGLDALKNGCRSWDNEEHYGGIGIKIPARQPILEE